MSVEPNTEYVRDLMKNFSEMRQTEQQWHLKDNLNEGKNQNIIRQLHTQPYVFVRTDAVKPSLTQPYTGPYKVLRKTEKYFILEQPDGKEKSYSLDRLKPCFTPAVPEEPEMSISQDSELQPHGQIAPNSELQPHGQNALNSELDPHGQFNLLDDSGNSETHIHPFHQTPPPLPFPIQSNGGSRPAERGSSRTSVDRGGPPGSRRRHADSTGTGRPTQPSKASSPPITRRSNSQEGAQPAAAEARSRSGRTLRAPAWFGDYDMGR
jgi:hypothetical protein